MLFFVLVVILLFKMVPWRSAEAGECLRVPQAVTRLVEKMCVSGELHPDVSYSAAAVRSVLMNRQCVLSKVY